MKKRCIKRISGFTLIEMLVVIIIIGILASVALPQYQKAVEKARIAKVLPVLRSLYNAGQEHYLKYRQYPTKFSDLGVNLPCQGNERWTTLMPADSACSIGEWSYQVYNITSSNADYITVGRIRGPYAGIGFNIYYTGQYKGKIICAERRSSGVSYSGHNRGDYCQKFFKGKLIGSGTMYEFTTN